MPWRVSRLLLPRTRADRWRELAADASIRLGRSLLRLHLVFLHHPPPPILQEPPTKSTIDEPPSARVGGDEDVGGGDHGTQVVAADDDRRPRSRWPCANGRRRETRHSARSSQSPCYCLERNELHWSATGEVVILRAVPVVSGTSGRRLDEAETRALPAPALLSSWEPLAAAPQGTPRLPIGRLPRLAASAPQPMRTAPPQIRPRLPRCAFVSV